MIMAVDLKDYIATIPNYPIKGVLFRNVTPILQDGEAFCEAVHRLADIAPQHLALVVDGPLHQGNALRR